MGFGPWGFKSLRPHCCEDAQPVPVVQELLVSLRHRHRSKPLFAGAVFIVLALALAACVTYKPGTFALSQPAGIGDVRLHFAVCLNVEEGKCSPSGVETDGQALMAISVPKGTGAPSTVTAVPTLGGPTVILTRNDQVAQAVTEATQGSDKPWPPAGTEGVGYISPVVTQEEGLREWTVDVDLALPPVADGGPFAGPFPVSLWIGSRTASAEGPPEEAPDRPVDCALEEESISAGEARCNFATEGSLATSDLKITPPPQGSAFLGGRAKLSFPFSFAGTAATLPSFNLTATSTLPKAKLALGGPTFVPGAPDPTTRRSPAASGTVNVTVPKNAKPGVYDVTLTATTAQGGSVSQVAKLKVGKAKIQLGGVKLNKVKGTATLSVKVPAAGTLTVSGKGLAKTKAKAKKAKRLKVQIKPNAKTKSLLTEEGLAKVKAKISFKPTGAIAVVKTKGVTLKQS